MLSKMSKAQISPQLERDFGNPARFYEAISLRQKKNPLFLPKHLRPRTKLKRNLSKYLNLSVWGISPATKGHLIISLISVSKQNTNDGPTTLSVISSETFQIAKDENIQLSTQLATSSSINIQARDLDLMLVIAFHPQLSEATGSITAAMKDHMRQIFANSHRSRTDDALDPSAIHICVMDISSKSARFVKEKSCLRATSNMASRSWMWPVLAKRQSIVLCAQPRVDLVRPVRASMGSKLFSDVEVTWSSSKREVSDASEDNTREPPQEDVASELLAASKSIAAANANYLVYHYMYRDPETQLFHAKKEIKACAECVWCGSYFGANCKTNKKRIRESLGNEFQKPTFSCNPMNATTKQAIEYLLLHLRNCHYHFDYHSMRDVDGNLFIFMMRNRKHDLAVSSLNAERRLNLSFRCSRHKSYRRSLLNYNLAMIKIPTPAIEIAPKVKPAVKSSSSSAEAENIIRRQYYHPRTGVPIVNEELEYESEDERDIRWDLMMANNAIDEFEDVGYEEKVFMKLWNTHIASFPPYSDGYIPIVIERFVRKFAAEICRQHLRYHCLFHLLTMYDFGLLRANEIQYYMMIVDRQAKEEKDEANLANVQMKN